MSDVKQTIQVTNAGMSPILSIAQGTGMVEFEFTVSDFQIPAGSTAVAHNIQPTGNVVSQVCTLVGNVITVTPPAYYFLRGKNYMQIQVTGADGVNLFTFLIEVWCSPNISAPVVSQNPDLISQLMAMIGNTQDLDTSAKNNLVAAINEIYARGVVDILDTEEEIEANTDTGKASGALVTKRLICDLGGCRFGYTADGLPGYKKEGADTVYPFLSTYEALVPTLTGASDNVIASDNNSSYPPWYAFSNTCMYISDASSDAYIGYNFSEPVTVKMVLWGGSSDYPGFCNTAELQASDDGDIWDTIQTVNGSSSTSTKPEYAAIEASEAHQYWRVKNTGASYRMGILYLQFLGTTQ